MDARWLLTRKEGRRFYVNLGLRNQQGHNNRNESNNEQSRQSQLNDEGSQSKECEDDTHSLQMQFGVPVNDPNAMHASTVRGNPRLPGSLTSLRARGGQIHSSSSRLSTRVVEQQEGCKILSHQTLLSEQEELKSQLSNAKQVIEKMSSKIDELTKRISTLESQLKGEKQKQWAEMDEVRARYEEERNSAIKAKEDHVRVHQQLMELQMAHSELQVKGNNSAEVQELRRKVDELEVENTKIQAVLAQLTVDQANKEYMLKMQSKRASDAESMVVDVKHKIVITKLDKDVQELHKTTEVIGNLCAKYPSLTELSSLLSVCEQVEMEGKRVREEQQMAFEALKEQLRQGERLDNLTPIPPPSMPEAVEPSPELMHKLKLMAESAAPSGSQTMSPPGFESPVAAPQPPLPDVPSSMAQYTGQQTAQAPVPTQQYATVPPPQLEMPLDSYGLSTVDDPPPVSSGQLSSFVQPAPLVPAPSNKPSLLRNRAARQTAQPSSQPVTSFGQASASQTVTTMSYVVPQTTAQMQVQTGSTGDVAAANVNSQVYPAAALPDATGVQQANANANRVALLKQKVTDQIPDLTGAEFRDAVRAARADHDGFKQFNGDLDQISPIVVQEARRRRAHQAAMAVPAPMFAGPQAFVPLATEWVPSVEPGLKCCICQDVMEVNDKHIHRCMGCMAMYHHHCIKNWLSTSPTCPMCRRNLQMDEKLMQSQ